MRDAALLPPTPVSQIMEAVRPRAAKRGLETPLELWGFFVEMCRRNLHVVLCFSPIGDAFRERLRANPSIVNCCTIDWWVPAPMFPVDTHAHAAFSPQRLDCTF